MTPKQWVGRPFEPMRHAWVCGRHSGIPLCCRVFYLLTRWIVHSRRYGYAACIGYRRVYRWMSGLDWTYRPCPVCALRRRRVEPLRDCACDGSCWTSLRCEVNA